MTRSVVISGPPGVGKSTLARSLAGRYGMEWISGGDVLKDMARERGFAPAGDDWWDTPDGMRFLAMREDDFEFDRSMDARLVEMCENGGAVITSYTLPWLTDSAVRVWLDCSRDVSARRIQARDDVGSQEAYRIALDRYERNTRLYKRHYGFTFGRDESVFDILVETDGKGADMVLDETAKRLDGML